MKATPSSPERLVFLYFLVPSTGFWQLNVELHLRMFQVLLVTVTMQSREGVKSRTAEVQASLSERQTAKLCLTRC